MPGLWPSVDHKITNMTFCSSSTDLDMMTLGAPHNQVREAPSAVPEVHGQAPAHATEDGTPQAGHKILDRRQRWSALPWDGDPGAPSNGETGEIPSVTQQRWGPRTPSTLLPLVLAPWPLGMRSPWSVIFTRSGTSREQLRREDLGWALRMRQWTMEATGHRTGRVSSLQGPQARPRRLPTKWAEGITGACSHLGLSLQEACGQGYDKHMHMHMCMCVLAYIHEQVHTGTWVCAYTHAHIYVNVCTRVFCYNCQKETHIGGTSWANPACRLSPGLAAEKRSDPSWPGRTPCLPGPATRLPPRPAGSPWGRCGSAAAGLPWPVPCSRRNCLCRGPAGPPVCRENKLTLSLGGWGHQRSQCPSNLETGHSDEVDSGFFSKDI